MQVVQAKQEFSENDGNVCFAECSRFELRTEYQDLSRYDARLLMHLPNLDMSHQQDIPSLGSQDVS